MFIENRSNLCAQSRKCFCPLQPQLQLIHLLSIPEKLKGGHVDATINKNSPREWGINLHLDTNYAGEFLLQFLKFRHNHVTRT
jgi:hypothetical protein